MSTVTVKGFRKVRTYVVAMAVSVKTGENLKEVCEVAAREWAAEQGIAIASVHYNDATFFRTQSVEDEPYIEWNSVVNDWRATVTVTEAVAPIADESGVRIVNAQEADASGHAWDGEEN